LYNRQKKLHPEVLKSYIPHASQVERMGVFKKPIDDFAGAAMSHKPMRSFGLK
jgi:hypothetical protein